MLLIDAGNSRIKWALVDGGEWLQRGVAEISDSASLSTVLAGLPRPQRILVSNVAGDAVARQIAEACSAWPAALEFIQARPRQCGVRNSYLRSEQLGSDRWAALIAAWHGVRASCLVVNCGTATTVDALSSDGEFLGGLILPGLDMMRDALVSGAAQLRPAAGDWEDFPRTTANAMYSGAIKATVGAIRQQHALLRKADAPCLLGGGAARAIWSHLGLPARLEEDLVLRGLQLIGQETGGASE